MAKILYLSQIIALDKTIKSRMHSVTSDLYKKLQKGSLFNGMHREYSPLNDEDKEILPAESQKVQHTVEEIVKATQKCLTEFWDMAYRRELGNTGAFADVVVDGTVLISKAPVGSLLFFEKQLNDLKATFDKIPTLDLNDDWNYDEKSGLYRTTPTKTHRTKKTPKVIVKAQATEHHQAQTEIFMDDIIVGHWTNTKISGAMSPVKKEQLVAKVEKLINAIKVARNEANNYKEAEIPPSVGAAIFGYLEFGE